MRQQPRTEPCDKPGLRCSEHADARCCPAASAGCCSVDRHSPGPAAGSSITGCCPAGRGGLHHTSAAFPGAAPSAAAEVGAACSCRACAGCSGPSSWPRAARAEGARPRAGTGVAAASLGARAPYWHHGPAPAPACQPEFDSDAAIVRTAKLMRMVSGITRISACVKLRC